MRRFNFSLSQAQINFDYIDYFYSIAELPSPSESGGEMEGGNFPLVTHPGSELMEDEGDQGSLTSPNLGKYQIRYKIEVMEYMMPQHILLLMLISSQWYVAMASGKLNSLSNQV